jgi:hypothetical protein
VASGILKNNPHMTSQQAKQSMKGVILEVGTNGA